MLGCDMVEIGRIQKAYDKFGMKFAQRILTPNETELFLQHNKRISFLAGRFAAKEAIAKTLQTGFAHGVTFHSIEVLPCEVSSSPRVNLMLSEQTEQLILGRLTGLPANTATTTTTTITSGTPHRSEHSEHSHRIVVEVSISHCRTYAMAVSRAVLVPLT